MHVCVTSSAGITLRSNQHAYSSNRKCVPSIHMHTLQTGIKQTVHTQPAQHHAANNRGLQQQETTVMDYSQPKNVDDNDTQPRCA